MAIISPDILGGIMRGAENPSGERQGDLHEKMRKMQAIIDVYSPSVCLDEKDFTDEYGTEAVREDLHTVAVTMDSIAHEREEFGYSEKEEEVKLRSEAMERTIAHEGEMSEWFGSEVHILKTAKYDDYRNGVDFVLEFDIEDPEVIGLTGKVHRIALAVDATTSRDTNAVRKKIDRAVTKVVSGGAKVKYFKSEVEPGNKKGPLEHVVPVIIGIEARNVYQMIESVYAYIMLGKISPEKRSSQQQRLFEAAKNAVVNSPAQIVFLQEISMQLQMYLTVLGRIDKPNQQMIEQVDSLKKIIDSVLVEKEEAGLSAGAMSNDLTFKVIESVVSQA